MRQCLISLAALSVVLIAPLAYADCGCAATSVAAAPTNTTSYAPTAYATYYTPTVAYSAPVTYTSYYVPAATSYTTYYAPAVSSVTAVPYVSYYAPATSYVTYYSPSVAVAPVTYSTYYYGRPGTSIYGTPRVYVPAEPVRNTLRALTP